MAQTKNERLWARFDEGQIASAIRGDGADFIPSPTYRGSHDDLLVLRQLCLWADEREAWPVASAAISEAIHSAINRQKALGLVWACLLVGDDMWERLVTDDLAWHVLAEAENESPAPASAEDANLRQAVRSRLSNEPPGPLTPDRLVAFLDREGIDPASYALGGGHPTETYVFDRRGNRWVVYYSERGLESGLTEFEQQSDALSYLLNLLVRDPTTRSR